MNLSARFEHQKELRRTCKAEYYTRDREAEEGSKEESLKRSLIARNFCGECHALKCVKCRAADRVFVQGGVGLERLKFD